MFLLYSICLVCPVLLIVEPLFTLKIKPAKYKPAGKIPADLFNQSNQLNQEYFQGTNYIRVSVVLLGHC